MLDEAAITSIAKTTARISTMADGTAFWIGQLIQAITEEDPEAAFRAYRYLKRQPPTAECDDNG